MHMSSRSWLAVLMVAVSTSSVVPVVPAFAAREKAARAEQSAPVNINTANVDELMSLDGIGRKVAEKIVEYRTTHGGFRKPAEIRRVDGIGAGLWERNRERIVVK